MANGIMGEYVERYESRTLKILSNILLYPLIRRRVDEIVKAVYMQW